MFLGLMCCGCTLFTVEQNSLQPESKCQAETDKLMLITGKEKSHSSEWMDLLGILNEALVKMALNVSEHRKTPALHSTVGCLTLLVSIPPEQRWWDYCKITPHPFAHVSLVL